ncbi:MAG TPA: hypothetical protein VFZ53_08470 [Polyangiaceae bacterium]
MSEPCREEIEQHRGGEHDEAAAAVGLTAPVAGAFGAATAEPPAFSDNVSPYRRTW